VKIEITIDDLVQKCPDCRGTGHAADGACDRCEGFGEWLTPTGAALAELVYTLIDNRLADYARRNNR
jgi:hypothetical protein